MYRSCADIIRDLVSTMDTPSGDVVKKFRTSPKFKPPRRNPSVQNKSNREDYMKEYMQEYREEGKSYQKVPENLKELKRKQKKRLEEKFK